MNVVMLYMLANQTKVFERYVSTSMQIMNQEGLKPNVASCAHVTVRVGIGLQIITPFFVFCGNLDILVPAKL